MTVIAGLVTEEGVVLGADRMLSNCSQKSDFGPKIFERNGWAFAVTGSVRTIQLMEKVSKEKKVVTRSDVIDLSAALYEELKAKGLGSAGAGEMPLFDSCFLVATTDGLFYIDRDFGVVEHKKFHAGGIGCEYALGVLHDGFSRTPPVELISRAVEAANAFSPHCGGGPDVVAIARTESTKIIGEILRERGDGARK